MTTYTSIIKTVSREVYAPQTRQLNKKTTVNVNHVSVVKVKGYRYNAQEFLLNNTVKKLLNSPSVKDGYKILTGDEKKDVERIKIFVEMVATQPQKTMDMPLIRFTEMVLKDFAKRVDGVDLERVGRTAGEWCKNPAMRVKG